ISPAGLIRAGEDALLFRNRAAMNALSSSAGLFQRNTAHGGFRFFLYVRFTFAAATPPGKRETLFHGFLEVFIAVGLGCVGFAKSQRAVIERLLNFFQQLDYVRGQILLRDERFSFLAGAVATRKH